MTDTLDAIAREMQLFADATSEHGSIDAAIVREWIARLAALSNQGEGAEPVAWVLSYPDGSISKIAAVYRVKSDADKHIASYGGSLDLVAAPLYLHPAEADRRDAETLGRCEFGPYHDWRGDGICETCGIHIADIAEANAKDAARYRWIREPQNDSQHLVAAYATAGLDDKIDAAIAATQEQT